MSNESLLIANRGEIAVRIARAAAGLGLRTVAIASEDDAACAHLRHADHAVVLRGRGAAAYLDEAQVVDVAKQNGCSLVHPGYGFLSERASFARRCAEAGLTLIAPAPEALDVLGDKAQARALAAGLSVPILRGTPAGATPDQLRAFMAELGGAPILIKAVAGGGGRGMRIVTDGAQIDEAHARCASEALAAFGDGSLYAEQLISRARHIEVQIIGDGTGAVSHVWDRECTLQRRHQKLIELAPSLPLPAVVRGELLASAVRIGEKLNYRGLGTIEFLYDCDRDTFVFIEANPRLQVEHTVTEQVTGIDLVSAQIEIARGKKLRELGLLQPSIPAPRGRAVQLRVNMESLGADGSVRPAGGTLSVFEAPTGPGVRVDTHGYAGYRQSPAFDSLLAKVIVHHAASDAPPALFARAKRALRELRIEGVETNRGLLQALLEHPRVASGDVYTRFVEDNAAELLSAPLQAPLFASAGSGGAGLPRARSSDPLAVLELGKQALEPAAGSDLHASDGEVAVPAPMPGSIVSLSVALGDHVQKGQPLLVMEAMKMEHVIGAPQSGVVHALGVAAGETVYEGHVLVLLEPREVAGADAAADVAVDLDAIRPDLAEVIQRHAFGLDDAPVRVEAAKKRHAQGNRMARENLAELCDPGSFVEYGALVIAAQRRRRSEEDLIEKTPADGLISGIGRVNGALFGADASQCVVLSYDYAVLAGTQGHQNHRKKDRLFEVAERMRLPVVLFAEGGGGRPGDTDSLTVSGLDCMAFHLFGKLSGLVPLVGIGNGRCFAGNAALLGTCDVVIATKNSNLGMGGPAMIEGGGLGVFRPEDIGPINVQKKSGVVDIAVSDEAEAVAVAKKYLSYFQGSLPRYEYADQRLLRSAIPENRLRVYDVRNVLKTLCDTDSVLELRRDFGRSMLTALVRIEGKPMGVIANDPAHLGGAIDSDAADKAARFMQLCDAFDLPILFLCDTPGIMVGPEIEKTGLVRHAARLFVTSASLSVPFMTIVLRKGYGLGAQTMAGGSFKAPLLCVAWPTGEFGGMGLEGAVKLAFRKELAAIADPDERKKAFDAMVAAAYRYGKGTNVASTFEIDDVIDPVDSRRVIATTLGGFKPLPRAGKKRPCVDTW
jgi:acetyl/propionyl-CoA carboxylase alpha subunit